MVVNPPRFLQIEPTTRCNFTCGFCCGRSMEQRDLDFDAFEAILDALPSVEHLELQGEGEPLLHPRFFDMLASARRRGIEVSFITNGSLLSRTTIEAILEGGVTKVSVSLESADPETFQTIRGGKLSKVIGNLEALVSARAQRASTTPAIGFSVTVLQGTRDHLPAIFELYRTLHLDGGITIQPLQRMASYTQVYGPEVFAQTLSSEQVDDLWLRFLADPELRSIQRNRQPDAGFYESLMKGWAPARGRCPWLEQGLYVDMHGHATPCCMIKDHATHGLGTMGVDTVDHILRGREALRTTLGKGQIPTACTHCELAELATMPKVHLVRLALRGLRTRLRSPTHAASGNGAAPAGSRIALRLPRRDKPSRRSSTGERSG